MAAPHSKCQFGPRDTMNDNNKNEEYCVSISLPFSSSRCAEIAYDVLRVDAEPKRSQVNKKFVVENNMLNAEFKSTSLKSLRVGVNSFFDYVILIIETIDQFGPPRSKTYSHYNA